MLFYFTPVWVNHEGNYIDFDIDEEVLGNTNFVASAYGRNLKGLLEYANKNNGFLYQTEDTKKVSQLLARNGLQLPTPLKLSDSDIIISKDIKNVKQTKFATFCLSLKIQNKKHPKIGCFLWRSRRDSNSRAGV